MHHRERKKMSYLLVYAIIHFLNPVTSETIETTEIIATTIEDNFDNNIINFEEDFSVKLNKKYGAVPWHSTDKFNKDALRYTIVKNREEKKEKDKIRGEDKKYNETQVESQDKASQIVTETTPVADYGVIPLELLSTTENILVHILESTTEPDLLVIPLSTPKNISQIEIKQTVTLPVSTESTDIATEYTTIAENDNKVTTVSEDYETTTKEKRERNTEIVVESPKFTQSITKLNDTGNLKITAEHLLENFTTSDNLETKNSTKTAAIGSKIIKITTETNYQNISSNVTIPQLNVTKLIKHKKLNILENVTENVEKRVINETKQESLKTNSSEPIDKINRDDFDSSEFLEDVHVFTELDTEEENVPEDYYDAKDVVPTTAPKTDALSVIFGLAGSVVESVVESVAERVVPKGLYDLFKRMQRQNEALEAERLRSREENGGIGQFTRGILKSLSSGLSKPLSQLMAGVKDIGSLDTDRGFVSSLASGVTSVATSVASAADAFKDKVQAIYPGTVWCGDGHSATARSSDLGLFFFTDTCCRQHDACKIFIKAGDTKYGLTNTGLFTRSHCSCDAKFRECLRRTSSLVSAQIGLTYFNVLGPQCFRKAHPIVKCVRRTRITGQKCEEYELDYTKPKMWQWFDNETF